MLREKIRKPELAFEDDHMSASASWNTSSKTCIALFRYEIADLDCLAVAKKETNFPFARYLI